MLFASDAALVAMAGAVMLLLAVGALAMDRRRHRRDRVGAPDSVGWVPWTGVFVLCAILGGGLLAAAIPGLIRG